MTDVFAVDFDPEDLTIDEIDEVERIAECQLDGLFSAGQPRGKSLRAIVFVLKRRENPEVTLEEVGRLRIKMGAAGADPTNAGATASS